MTQPKSVAFGFAVGAITYVLTPVDPPADPGGEGPLPDALREFLKSGVTYQKAIRNWRAIAFGALAMAAAREL